MGLAEIEVHFELTGSITVKYHTIEFSLDPKVYTGSISNIKKYIVGVIKKNYENRFKFFDTNIMLPPPEDYNHVAERIVRLLEGSQNYPIWQTMFA